MENRTRPDTKFVYNFDCPMEIIWALSKTVRQKPASCLWGQQRSNQLAHLCSLLISCSSFVSCIDITYKPRCEKTGLRGFRPGPTKTGLCSHRRWLEAWYVRFKELRNCTICVAKTKALISFAVTAQLICACVFAYAKFGFLMTRLIPSSTYIWNSELSLL